MENVRSQIKPQKKIDLYIMRLQRHKGRGNPCPIKRQKQTLEKKRDARSEQLCNKCPIRKKKPIRQLEPQIMK